MLLYPQVRLDDIPNLPYHLWREMCARVDAWRAGRLPGRG